MTPGARLVGVEEAMAQVKAYREASMAALHAAALESAQALAGALKEATPVGVYDEPGAQPVARRPGAAREGWHAGGINQYAAAVYNNVQHTKWLLFPPGVDEWVIEPKGEGDERGHHLLLFEQDGQRRLADLTVRQPQALNEAMRTVLADARAVAEAKTRDLFGTGRFQDFIQVRG